MTLPVQNHPAVMEGVCVDEVSVCREAGIVPIFDMRTRDFIAFASPQAQRRVIAGVEELGSPYQIAVAVADFEIDIRVAVRRGIRNDVTDGDRPVRGTDQCVGSDAVPHGSGRIVAG